MFQQFDNFAARLVGDVLNHYPGLHADPSNLGKVLAPYPSDEWSSLNLTPFVAEPQTADARPYFNSVQNIDELLNAYAQARQVKPFEQDIAHANDHVSDYAAKFLDSIFNRARTTIDDADVQRISAFVSNLDLYTAVKAIESLLNSQADLVLLKIAETKQWTLHFDHLAIRCGCSERGDAEGVVANLCLHHGYAPSQVSSENYFQFEDGWDAFVLYKVLENGQQLRLFVDQSSVEHSPQIIQHWNHVYGFTAHHLALRASCMVNGKRCAVPLPELTAAIKQYNIEVLTATGQYTEGLLEQVFTRPELNTGVPERIRENLRKVDVTLESSIENGKLLELLSRREMAEALKPDYFNLYGITFDTHNPLHSAPVYPYFLPAQAAHVIRTSVQVA